MIIIVCVFDFQLLIKNLNDAKGKQWRSSNRLFSLKCIILFIGINFLWNLFKLS